MSKEEKKPLPPGYRKPGPIRGCTSCIHSKGSPLLCEKYQEPSGWVSWDHICDDYEPEQHYKDRAKEHEKTGGVIRYG